MPQPIAPLAIELRHSTDYRDDLEHEEVARVLSELPDEHPARASYLAGERASADSIGLAHMLAERMGLVERLMVVRKPAADQSWARYKGQQPGR